MLWDFFTSRNWPILASLEESLTKELAELKNKYKWKWEIKQTILGRYNVNISVNNKGVRSDEKFAFFEC